jgi:serine phosphatase RsbU (regulator of sigma subunit)
MAASAIDAAEPTAEPIVAAEARLDRASWVVMTVAVTYAALGVLHMLYTLSLPSDGWTLLSLRTSGRPGLVFERNVAGWPSPIQPGDRLVAIDGQSVEEIMGRWLTARPRAPTTWAVGETASYVVVRDGSQVSLDVPLGRRPLTVVLDAVRGATIEVILLLTFAATGVFAFFRVPRQPAAQAMLVLAANEVVGLGVHYSVAGDPSPAELLDPIAGPARLVLLLLFYSVYVSFWLHLFLVFPTAKWPLRRYRLETLSAIYVAPLLPELLALGVSLPQPTSFGSNLPVALIGNVVVVLFVACASLVHSLRTLRAPVARAQLRWLLLALVLALGVNNLIALLNVLLFGESPILQALAALLAASFPIGVGIAIARYRLFDIDVVINRALVYGALTATLAIAYFGGVAILQPSFRTLTGQTSDLAVVVSTLLSVAIFTPVRQGLQRLVDRTFYRQKYDATRTLNAFGASLSHAIDISTLIRQLTAAVEVTMQPAFVSVWLTRRAGGGTDRSVDDDRSAGSAGAPETADAAALELPADDRVVGAVLEHGATVPVRRLAVTSPTLRTLVASGAELVVPLVSQGELVGMLALGRHLSGHGYSVDDRLLLDRLAAQAAPALRVAQLVEQQRAEHLVRDRVEQELVLAHNIQLALLPRSLPALPGWHVTARYQPARAVGGDFYDFVQRPDGRIVLIVGDVAGKGMSAALVMSQTLTTLRAIARREVPPAEVLAEANEQLLPSMPAGLFVTCLLLLLDPDTGTIRFANAGHMQPLRRGADDVLELRARGLPLGRFAGTTYAEHTATIAQGDILFLYTDGLVEAQNPQREMFGIPRLVALLGRWDDGETLLEGLLRELESFAGAGQEREDDLAMVALQRARAGAGA